MTLLTDILIPFIGMLIVLVFIHELGHYLAARWFGVAVNRFSVGMGPVLYKKTDKKGTEWALSLLPIGGYVAMVDKETDFPTERKVHGETYNQKTRWQKAIILLAGPFMNVITGIAIFTAIAMTYQVNITPPIIDQVVENSPAEKAGLKSGDEIIKINNRSITYYKQIVMIMQANLDDPINLVINRNNEIINTTLIPEKNISYTENGRKIEKGIIGIISKNPVFKKTGFIQSFSISLNLAYDSTIGNLKAIGQIFQGERSTDSISGVVGMAETTQKASQSWMNYLTFVAFISLNLAFVNMLPLPVLDGGQLLILTLEGISRKNIPDQIKTKIMMTGAAIVVMLIIFTTGNDLRFIL